MEIDSNTLGSTNRRPNFCMIEICSTCKSDDMVNRKINKFGLCRAFGSWVYDLYEYYNDRLGDKNIYIHIMYICVLHLVSFTWGVL